MIILHIAYLTKDLFWGVNVAVPQHIRAQREFAEVGFINVNNINIDTIERQFEYTKDNILDSLPKPFCTPDIVVFHEVYRPPFIHIYKELNRKGIPYVIIPHGCLTDDAQHSKRLKKVTANILIFNKFIRSARAVQCVSEQEKDRISIKCCKFVGSNGVDEPRITKMEFNQSSVRFVNICRIDIKIKGFDLLLDAIVKKKDFLRKCNAEFCIVGATEGDDSKELKRMIEESGVSDLVKVHAAVTGREKEEMLLNSDIYIMTSRTEGMPMGLLEALNYGVPCLVTRGASVKDLVESNNVGWGCETNSDSISEAIQLSIQGRDKWPEKSDNAKDLLRNEFRWNIVAAKTIEKYKELAN